MFLSSTRQSYRPWNQRIMVMGHLFLFKKINIIILIRRKLTIPFKKEFKPFCSLYSTLFHFFSCKLWTDAKASNKVIKIIAFIFEKLI